ncbi:hypothetical protein DS745_09865 [Anaerobacillus alkaliphilus]|uniref:DUF1795 domain-containing protein n=1 Tax=Anaerobacillus alkaliphilus TaxID=1548597 RepID=A0A4Q0VTL7_9BACI|nr:hypothetical protein [Anaerobacillus alkaliphilus]RXJ01773.1 hypothetical protein DS745_09865 [Anaerobacillus alkaliphilus]
MSHKVVHIFLIILLTALVGCSKATEEVTDNNPNGDGNNYYDNSELGISIEAETGWVLEKETSQTVKFTRDNIIGLISVIPKEKTVSEIKKELLSGAGEVTVVGEGLNFIAWKTELEESIRTQIWIEEKSDRQIIVTMMTPDEMFEGNRETIEDFREMIEIY